MAQFHSFGYQSQSITEEKKEFFERKLPFLKGGYMYYSAGSPSVFYLHSYRIELSPFSVIKAFDLMACKEYSTASQSDTIFMS